MLLHCTCAKTDFHMLLLCPYPAQGATLGASAKLPTLTALRRQAGAGLLMRQGAVKLSQCILRDPIACSVRLVLQLSIFGSGYLCNRSAQHRVPSNKEALHQPWIMQTRELTIAPETERLPWWRPA